MVITESKAGTFVAVSTRTYIRVASERDANAMAKMQKKRIAIIAKDIRTDPMGHS
jgi:hypothetical protein